MIRGLIYLIIILALAYGAVWFADHPGRVAVEWQGYFLETSVGVLILAVVGVAIALMILFLLLRGLRSAPQRWARAREARRRRRGYQAVTRGLVAAAAGDPSQARRYADRADRLLDEPSLTLLLDAQAAQLEGDEATAQDKFRAMVARPETEFLGLRGLLVQAMKEGDTDRAMALADRARQLRPETPWVLTTLFDLQTGRGRLNEAIETLEHQRRRGLIEPEEARHRRAVLLHALSCQEEEHGENDAALRSARKAHQLDPAFAPAAVRAARLLAAAGQARKARKVIEKAWVAAPHPALAAAYNDSATNHNEAPPERVKRFERLLELRADHRESHLAVAEAALAAGLWGKARGHLQEALKREPTARVYRLMAELEEREHNDTLRARNWLVEATQAAPDPAYICGECGWIAADWSLRCPHCGAFDSLRWDRPPAGAAMTLERQGRALVPVEAPATPPEEAKAEPGEPPGPPGREPPSARPAPARPVDAAQAAS